MFLRTRYPERVAPQIFCASSAAPCSVIDVTRRTIVDFSVRTENNMRTRTFIHRARRATRRSGGEVGAVEFSYSATEGAPAHGNLPAVHPAAEAASPEGGGDADAVTMAELLSHEQPQIIAAALSQLGAERGAARGCRHPRLQRLRADGGGLGA